MVTCAYVCDITPPLPNKPALRLYRRLHDLLCPHPPPIFVSIPVSVLGVWVALDWRCDNPGFYEGRASGLRPDTIQGCRPSLAILRGTVASLGAIERLVLVLLPIHLRHLLRLAVEVHSSVLVVGHLLLSEGGRVTLQGAL